MLDKNVLMKKASLLGLILFASSASPVWAAPLQTLDSIDLIANDDGTKIQLHTDSIVPYSVVSESASKAVIDIEGVQPASTVKTDFNQSENVSHVIIQPRSGNKVRITIRGHHLSSPSISFQPIISSKTARSSSSQQPGLIQEVKALRSSIQHARKPKKVSTASTPKVEEVAFSTMAVHEPPAVAMTLGPDMDKVSTSSSSKAIKTKTAQAKTASEPEDPLIQALTGPTASESNTLSTNDIASDVLTDLPLELPDGLDNDSPQDSAVGALALGSQTVVNPDSDENMLTQDGQTITIDLSAMNTWWEQLKNTLTEQSNTLWMAGLSLLAILAGAIGWRYRKGLAKRVNPMAQDLNPSGQQAQTGFQQAMANHQMNQQEQQVRQEQQQSSVRSANRQPIGMGRLQGNTTQQMPPSVAQALAAGIAPQMPAQSPNQQPPAQAIHQSAPVASKQVLNQYRQQQTPQAQARPTQAVAPALTKPAPTPPRTQQAMLQHAQQQRKAQQQQKLAQEALQAKGRPAPAPQGNKPVQAFQPLQLSPNNATLPANDDVLSFLKKVADHMDEDKRHTILQSIQNKQPRQ